MVDRYTPRKTFPQADRGSHLHQNGDVSETHLTQTFHLPARGGFSETTGRTFQEHQPLIPCQIVRREGEKPTAIGGGKNRKRPQR